MKKIVAVAIGIFYIAMGTMFVWGFFDKQSKESENENATSTEISNTTINNTASINNSTNETSQTPTSGTLSSTEVSKHNTASDCWMSIGTGVYNVTNYVDMHPGGADIVLMYCGKNATQAYNTQGGRGRGHSSRANSILETYRVGTLK